MIANLPNRRLYWSRHAAVPKPRTTDPLPFRHGWAMYEPYFKGKRILEIGPGRGPQFERLSPIAKSYALADISMGVLNNKLYDGRNRIHMLDYIAPSEQFDTVTFWYVLHYVPTTEAQSFFTFVCDCMEELGVAIFNWPDALDVDHAAVTAMPPGDGIGITPWRLSDLSQAMRPAGIHVEEIRYADDGDAVIIAMKNGHMLKELKGGT